jgi:heterodisulfide reductase subunit A
LTIEIDAVLRENRIMNPESQVSEKAIGAVMVVGGGIAGMQAALDLADAGYLVHLVETSPAIGGVMSELDKTFPTNDCAM